MKVDHVLILAAGKGTRMGEIGKELPKVLWPIFEKSLIELQLAFAKRLAPDAEVYVNTYYHKHVVANGVSDLDCNVIIEEEVLDIGGGIHNLARRLNYSGTLLILNCDQFLCFDEVYFEKGLLALKNVDSLLFSYEVNSNSLYNSLNSENNVFKGVIQNCDIARDTQHQTYTGMSLVKLEKLTPVLGASKYFNSVANPGLNKVGLLPVSDVEYWDFGTLFRYCDSISKVCSTDNRSMFKQFLIDENALDPKKLNQHNYNSKSGLNFTRKFIENTNGSIILGDSTLSELPERSVVFSDVFQPIPLEE